MGLVQRLLSIAGLPACKLTREVSEADLGKAVRAVLMASETIVPHPTRWAGVTKPIFQAVGMRSWKAMTASARHCQVGENDLGIVLTPSRNGGMLGDDRGFHDLSGSALTLSGGSTDAELGSALLTMEVRCI